MPGNVKSFEELFDKKWVGINFLAKYLKHFNFGKLGGYPLLGHNLKCFRILFCNKAFAAKGWASNFKSKS